MFDHGAVRSSGECVEENEDLYRVLIDYKKIPLIFHFLISFCYIAVGCVLFTNMFGRIDARTRMAFGVIVIGYGVFRMYKALKQYGGNRDGG